MKSQSQWEAIIFPFDSAITEQNTCQYFTQMDADSKLSSLQMDLVAHLGCLEEQGSNGPFFINSASLLWLPVSPFIPVGV